MNLINFIKNVWAFRKELSRYKPYDCRYGLALWSRAIKNLSQYMKDMLHKNDINPSKDGIIINIDECARLTDRLIANKFMYDACEIELKDKFDYDEFQKNQFDYVANLPEDEQNRVLLAKANLEKTTFSKLGQRMMNPTKGIFMWYTRHDDL